MVNIIIDPKNLWEYFINESGLDKKLVTIAEDTATKTEVLLTITSDGAMLIVEQDREEVCCATIRSHNFESKYKKILDRYILTKDSGDEKAKEEEEQDEIDLLYINYDNAMGATCDLIQAFTGVDILGDMLEDGQGCIVDEIMEGFMEVIKDVLEVEDIFLPGIEDFIRSSDDKNTDNDTLKSEV